jgi:hypothetical protein
MRAETEAKARALADHLRAEGRTEQAEHIERALARGPVATAMMHALRDACEAVLTAVEAIDPKTGLMAEELRLEVEKRLD